MQTYANPTQSTYVLQSRHVQLFGFHFLMLPLNSDGDLTFFRLNDKKFHIKTPKYLSKFCPL